MIARTAKAVRAGLVISKSVKNYMRCLMSKKLSQLGFILVSLLVLVMPLNTGNYLQMSDVSAVAATEPDIIRTDYSNTGYSTRIKTDTVIDMTEKNVFADDSVDDTVAIQAVIDSLNGTASSENHYTLLFPAGQIDISDQIYIDVSGITIKGMGSDKATGTRFVFKPGANVTYSTTGTVNEQEPEIDGKLWPGAAAFHVETRIKHSGEQNYLGSINFHWKSGVKMSDSGASKGDTVITLAKNGAKSFSVGQMVVIRAANTSEFYEQTDMPSEYRDDNAHIRTQSFHVIAVDESANTITLNKPLEFDVPYASATGYASKVIPITAVTDVTFEDFLFTQSLEDTKYSNLNADTYDAETNPNGVGYYYVNAAPEYAIHGILFKYADNCMVKNVSMYMTGSHPIVTEFATNITVKNNYIDGSWNKGKGGHGYLRFSKIDDSLLENNTVRNVRHLAIQWSSSGNIVKNNDLSCDINLHGGWERNNWIVGNTSHIVYPHRSWEDGSPETSTWYPIWWAAGTHASSWSSSSGYNNCLFGNDFNKQQSEEETITEWKYSDTSTIYHFGWDGTNWKHLTDSNGNNISTWGHNENLDYKDNGVYYEEFITPDDLYISEDVIALERFDNCTVKLLSKNGTVHEPLANWESSDTSVAEVQCGKITAISKGTAVVTATYPGTTEVFTCKVTVVNEGEEAIPEPDELSISKVVLSEENGKVTVTAFAKGGTGIKQYWFYVLGSGLVYEKSMPWSAVDSFEFDEPDGDYTVRVYCKDKAGNMLVHTVTPVE